MELGAMALCFRERHLHVRCSREEENRQNISLLFILRAAAIEFKSSTRSTYFQCPIEREASCVGVATHREPCENGQGCVPGPLTWAALVLMGQAGDQGP